MGNDISRRTVLRAGAVTGAAAAIAPTVAGRAPTARATRRTAAAGTLALATSGQIVTAYQLCSVLGANTLHAGLRSWVGDTGTAKVVSYDGLSAWQTVPSANTTDYIYTTIIDDHAFLQTVPMTVTVNYWDGPAGSFHLDYNSKTSTWRASPTVQVGGSNTWKSHTFQLDDASFANTQNNGASFRINTDGSANGVAFSRITVAKQGTMWLALSAPAFLRSIAVNTHIGQGQDDPTQAASAMSYAGFRAFRDSGQSGYDWTTICRNAGAKIDVLSPRDSSTTAVTRAEPLATAGVLLAIEGPNEPNNFPVTYDGQTSSMSGTFAPVAELQRDLYANVKANSTVSGYPVFHSSEAGGSEPDNQGLQFLVIPGTGTLMPQGTTYADYANTHNYVTQGGFTAVEDNQAWHAEAPATSEGAWDGMYSEYVDTWNKHFPGYTVDHVRPVPKVTTETGVKTSGTESVTEVQQGKLFLNLFLAAAKRGWSYTFIYMLHDSSTQGDWGLFHADWSPKWSARYLRNLTTILADSIDATPATSSLEYTIPDAGFTVHDLLLQKSDGSFWLAVWDDRPVGEATDNVTVTLANPVQTAAVYDPVTGPDAARTISNTASVQLTLSDHPQIIQLVS